MLGVYIHFPYCRSKCGYCDFASCAVAAMPHVAYADAVLRELAGRAPAFAGLALRTLYFGGGTPALWEVAQLARVVDGVRASFPAAAALEVTVEANPGDVDPVTLGRLRQAGVDRLSLGVQSLDDEALLLLGRRHSADQARRAVREARAVGFANIGLDLLLGLPGQRPAHHLAPRRIASAHSSRRTRDSPDDAP